MLSPPDLFAAVDETSEELPVFGLPGANEVCIKDIDVPFANAGLPKAGRRHLCPQTWACSFHTPTHTI